MDRFVASEMRRTGVPGVSVGILLGGQRYTSGYGITNVDHPLEVTPDTLFQIGSTTKTYTATAVMRLVEQGKIDLNVPVRKYIPDLKLRDKEVTRNVTMLHLLTHTGGWIGDFFADGGRGEDALQKVVAQMSKVKQLTPMGQVWSYNNSGFYIAGHVIEKLTRLPYDAAIKQLLIDPLGMKNSFFFAEEAIVHRVVAGHVTQGTKSTVARPWSLRRSVNPAGGIISSVKDQLDWAAFHMGDGKSPEGKRILRKATLRMMQQPQAPAGSLADFVGLSWLLKNVDGEQLVAHGGTTIGQLSAFLMVPGRGFAVTILTNSTRGGELHRAVVNFALESYLGIKPPDHPKTRLPAEQLAQYAGEYVVQSSGQSFNVESRAGGIVVHMPPPPRRPGAPKPPVPPPIPMSFVGADRVIGTKGHLKGTYGEFIRGPRGNVVWFRLGGRIHKRENRPARSRSAGSKPKTARRSKSSTRTRTPATKTR